MGNIFIKNEGTFNGVTNIGIKEAGTWEKRQITNILQKKNGSWNSSLTINGITTYKYGGWVETIPIRSEDSYNPSDLPVDADIIYVNEPGVPEVKTDSEGKVTEYTMTTVSQKNPVEINGSASIDTGYVPFDGQHGFVVDITARFAWTSQHFTETHCTLLNMMKEISPWPGIVIRYEDTVSNVLRIVADGNGAHASTLRIPSDSIYSIRITYDLTTVTVYNKLTNTTIDTYDYNFGNISDLTVRIGSSWNPATNSAWRFGVCDVYEFSIKHL